MKMLHRLLMILVGLALAGQACSGAQACYVKPPELFVMIMVDFSGSFLPLKSGDRVALNAITEGLVRVGEAEGKPVTVYWSIIGKRDDSSAPPCPTVTYRPSLLAFEPAPAPESGAPQPVKAATRISVQRPQEFKLALADCVVCMFNKAAQPPQQVTDVSDAFIRAAQTLSPPTDNRSPTPARAQLGDDRFIFAISDYIQELAPLSALESNALKDVRVMLLYRGKDVADAAPTTSPWELWGQKLQAAGAILVPSMKIGVLDDQKVASLFSTRVR
jgi:hypothetical protein